MLPLVDARHPDRFKIFKCGSKTYRIRFAAPAARMQAASQERVTLPYNKVAISSNNFSAFGHMDANWNSYAAEQIPEEIVYKGISFRTGEADYDNAVRCEGQQVNLPAGSKGVYLLVAATQDKDVTATFDAGMPVEVKIPYWTGFFGSGTWAPYQAYLREGDVAYVGSHRHDSKIRDEYYVQTYMYMVYVPVTPGSSLTLPKDADVTVLAATAVKETPDSVEEISDSVTHLERL